MKISTTGLNLIKKFEGCRLSAYKPVKSEKYYTIGYGHYGADVKEGMTITQSQADAYLISDCAKFEKYVNAIIEKKYFDMNQNQFDALVSFTFNCGNSNLTKLTAKCTRSYSEIAKAILNYNKSNGKVLDGLTRRRKAEQELFLKGGDKPPIAKPTLKSGSKGTQVSYLQKDLNYLYNAKLSCDGIFGANTLKYLKTFQQKNYLTCDGIYGNKSYQKMKALLK